MNDPGDFMIENGVLKKYKGTGGDVTIPDGVTEIGGRAFDGCSSLASVTIPDSVTKIGDSAFSGCSSLASVTIPDGVTEIGDSAFSGCSSLANVVIPYGVTAIGWDAFSDCTNLTSVTIPSSVEEMGFSVFDGCSLSITAETVPGSRVLGSCDVREIHTGDISKVEPEYRFAAVRGFIREGNADLDSERAKGHLKYLTNNAGWLRSAVLDAREVLAFMCENGLLKVKYVDAYSAEAEKRGDAELTAMILEYKNKLGGAVEKEAERKKAEADRFGDEWFRRNSERDIKKDGIQGMVFVVMGKLGFWRTRGELRDYLEEYGAVLDPSVNMNTDYLVTDDPESTAKKAPKARELGVPMISEKELNEMIGVYFKDAAHVEVPCWVKRIFPSAFEGYEKLTSVTIGDGVKEIGERAFSGCPSLASVTIPDGVTVIGRGAFSGCPSLASVTITACVKEIGERAFSGCTSLVSVAIPAGETEIGWAAFSGCEKLKSITIPDGVTKIGGYAFSGCTGLAAVTIPEGVTRINWEVFSECSSLTNVTVPDGVTEIGWGAFRGCMGLTDVMVPDGVKYIGSSAFSGCEKLKNVTIPISVTEIGSDAFSGCPDLTLRVPAGSFAEQYARRRRIPFKWI